jgi:hypothetical protein
VAGVDELLFRKTWDGPVGAGEPQQVEIDGRRGWQVDLPRNRPDEKPVTVVVDDAWAILLRLVSPETGALYELRAVAETPDPDDDLFVWAGRVAQSIAT